MNSRPRLPFIFFMIALITAPFAAEVFAVPAAPVLFESSQPDGTGFEARQWGDENINGWETKEGYTIVFDRNLDRWTYADRGPDGSLESSGTIVGKDRVPAWIQKKLRPGGEALSRIVIKGHTKELQYIRELGDIATGEGRPSLPELALPIETGYIATVMIKFTDRAGTYSASDFNTLLFGTGNFSMKDYYQEVSYGAFSVSGGPGGVAGWYTASNNHAYYGYANGFQRAAMLAKEAVAAADAAGFNFSPYDQDGDCYVDVVNIIHQGSGTEASGDTTDIWSHSWNFSNAGIGTYTTNDPCPAGGNIKVNDYIIEPEILWGSRQTMGVVAHEYGHALGLPDLYDVDGSSAGIGNWSLMAGGVWNYVSLAGDSPAHMDAWSKFKLGWVTPVEVTGTLTNESIQQAATSADVYKLLDGTPDSGEYFLVENRQRAGFDTGLPGAGLLIWHIDGAQTSNSNECYPGGPSCASQHYKVALVQADNQWDLELNNGGGNSGDPYPGSAGRTFFTGSSSPNSNLYNGSVSNVAITGISASGPTMTATLTAASTSCAYSITPAGASVGPEGGTGGVNVTAGGGCSWTAASNANWLTITSGSSGTGNGTVSYSVATNTGTSFRSGTMTIAGQTFSVNQAGACSYSISPSSASVGSKGGTGSVTVMTGTGCSWTAASNAAWITVTAGSTGSGRGKVSYSVAANTSRSSRSGTITIAGRTFTVREKGR